MRQTSHVDGSGDLLTKQMRTMDSPKKEHNKYLTLISEGICSKCDSRNLGTGREAAREHMETKHLNYHCPKCGKGLFLQHALTNHVASHKSKPRKKKARAEKTTSTSHNKCELCGKSCRNASGLSQHMRDKKHNTSAAIANRAAIFPGFQTNHISAADRYRAKCFGFVGTDHTSAAATGRAMTDSWHVDIMKGSRKGENLDDFMKRKVFPDEEYKRNSKELVDYLTKFVQHNIPFSVKKLFVGGSQGKKIDVLDNADVDLVMYINDYDTMEEFRNNLDDVLQTLEQHIKRDFNWAENVNVIDRTRHAVQFEVKLKGYDHPINVDLLPAIDLPEKAHSAKEMFNDMKSLTPDKQKFFSVCTSEKQTKFARQAPKQLKELTRLVKYWKKTENVPGKSYFFELLVRHLWETEWGEPEVFSMEEKFKNVIRSLTTTRSMRIIWPKLYDAEKYTTVPERPVMLDPLNPFQNVAPSGTDVGAIIQKAKSLHRRM